MADEYRNLIVPASQVDLARAVAASFGPGGIGMWTTPLSATGADPASHYISSGFVPEQFAYMVPCQTWETNEDGAWVLVSTEPGDPVAVYTAASEAGVICTKAEVNALFTAADVTAQEPYVAMGRLGLAIVNPVMEEA